MQSGSGTRQRVTCCTNMRPQVRISQFDTTHTSICRRVLAARRGEMRIIRTLIAIVGALAPVAALAQPCPGNPDALGTARVLSVSVATTPRVGRKQFPSTLPLAAKEVVLTFDDGPWPGTTTKVLDALKHECVHATFFLLGRNALAA